jgi:hypothetical protein
MVGKNELKGFILTKGIFDALDFARTFRDRQPPAPKASENRPIRRD